MALIATMSALVLGLLIASARSSYDAQSGEVTQMSANIIQLDRSLARYGGRSSARLRRPPHAWLAVRIDANRRARVLEPGYTVATAGHCSRRHLLVGSLLRR